MTELVHLIETITPEMWMTLKAAGY